MSSLANFVIVACAVLVIWLEYRRSAGSVVIHYNILNGIDSVGDWRLLWIYPGVLLAMTALNYLLACGGRSVDPFWPRLLAATSGVCGLSTIAALLLILLGHHTILS